MQTEQTNQELIFYGQPMALKGEKTMIQTVKLKDIKLNKNSRMNVSPDELEGLMQSIKEVGLLQPIGVIKTGKNYEICYGNRRFLACSKLGLTSIPAIVHEKKKESDIDLKNLTENVQRRNISLAEAGRYMVILGKEGLKNTEIAVRLGVTNNYVDSCLKAFDEVPKEFQDDLETNVGRQAGLKTSPGKISMTVANRIINARSVHGLSRPQVRKLFNAAKTDNDFQLDNVGKYAEAIKQGEEHFVKVVPKHKHVTITFRMPMKVYESLYQEQVTEGHYSSLKRYFIDVINGKKHSKNIKAE